MSKKGWNMNVDVEALEKFKQRAEKEGRSMTTILNRFIKLYGEGKLELWKEKD